MKQKLISKKGIIDPAQWEIVGRKDIETSFRSPISHWAPGPNIMMEACWTVCSRVETGEPAELLSEK